MKGGGSQAVKGANKAENERYCNRSFSLRNLMPQIPIARAKEKKVATPKGKREGNSLMAKKSFFLTLARCKNRRRSKGKKEDLPYWISDRPAARASFYITKVAPNARFTSLGLGRACVRACVCVLKRRRLTPFCSSAPAAFSLSNIYTVTQEEGKKIDSAPLRAS